MPSHRTGRRLTEIVAISGRQAVVCAALAALALAPSESLRAQGEAADPFAPAVLPAETPEGIPEIIVVENGLPIPDPAPGELQASVALPEDPALRRQLTQALRLVDSGRIDDAAQALGRLAERVGDQDVFVRLDGQQSLRSLKAEVQRQIGALSPEGRTAYEQTFGRAARRRLQDAGNDLDAVQQVATLYLHTEAGADALYRLATLYRDRGAFPEAAACLERLRTLLPEAATRFEPQLTLQLASNLWKSGDATAATAVLAAFHRANPSPPARIAGRTVTVSVPATASFAELERLLGARTDTVATGRGGEAAAAGVPFPVPRWSRELESATAASAAAPGGAGANVSLPARFPTVVGDLVLLPAAGGFFAFDRATGRPRWGYPSDGPDARAALAAEERLAEGRLATDGRAVFLVEADDTLRLADLVSAVPVNPPVLQQAVMQQAFFPPAIPGFAVNAIDGPVTPAGGGNQLSALDVTPPRQGNRLWTVGGATGSAEPQLAGHTFLGPPLVEHDRLYAIADRSGTARLVVIEATTGRLDWALDLGHSDIPLGSDPQRQAIGATPSLAGGLLICPTAGGAIVAVDLAGRSLAWGFRFPRSHPPNAYAMHDASQSVTVPAGWRDATPRLVGERLLLTPPEADQLYCLEAATGALRWQQPRGEHLFLATADRSRLLLVGRVGATLLNVADGSPAAGLLAFPAETAPSGRGYPTDGGYVQPLSDGTLLDIRLDAGTAKVLTRSSRGLVPGNLVWQDGLLFSVGREALRTFDDAGRLDAELAARLAADPGDAAALLRQADRHAAAGRYAEAIGDCRRAFAAAPSPETKNALVAALLDGVREKLPDTADYDAELRRLARP